MLRLSKLTDYAVVVLAEMGRDPEQWRTAPQIACAAGTPEPTVGKVLKLLGQAGLVASQRGARGGYRLAGSLASVSIVDVITAIDGPIALTACVDGGMGGCEAELRCAVRGRWDAVNLAIRNALAAITVADLLCPALPGTARFGEPAEVPSPWRRQTEGTARPGPVIVPLAAE